MAEIYTPFNPGESDAAFGSAVAAAAKKLSAPVNNPAAYGSVPAPPSPPRATAGDATATAIGLGNQVYGQLPGYNDSLANIGANIKSETAGHLPADVVSELSQLGAERGIATGSPGSPNSDAALLRSLGLTSLSLTDTGQKNLENILPTLPGASIYQNPNFYVTPEEQYNAELERNTLAAAPDPSAAAAANLAAARGGFGAGAGSGGIGGLRPPANDTAAFMAGAGGPAPAQMLQADPATAGTYIGGVWYPDGQGPSQNNDMLNALIKNYAPTDTGDELDPNYANMA